MLVFWKIISKDQDWIILLLKWGFGLFDYFLVILSYRLRSSWELYLRVLFRLRSFKRLYWVIVQCFELTIIGMTEWGRETQTISDAPEYFASMRTYRYVWTRLRVQLWNFSCPFDFGTSYDLSICIIFHLNADKHGISRLFVDWVACVEIGTTTEKKPWDDWNDNIDNLI